MPAGGPTSVFDLRFKQWLNKLKSFTDANAAAAYHELTDHAEMTALVEEVNALATEINNPLQVQHIALQLFQCASDPLRCPCFEPHLSQSAIIHLRLLAILPSMRRTGSGV